jgi:PAS domain-containing protein
MISGDLGSFTMEKRYIRKDDSVTWVNLTSSCIRKPDGKLEYTIAVIHDITGRKYAEEALDRAREELEVRVRERTVELKAANEALHAEIERSRGMEKEVTRANRMMHEILEKAPFGIYVVNENGYAEYANPAMLKMPMGRHKDFKSKSSFDVPVHSYIGLAERIKAALNGEHFFLGPLKCAMGPGRDPSTINFIGVPMEEGGAKKVLIFVEDVSGQKNMEDKLQKNEALLRDIVDSLK